MTLLKAPYPYFGGKSRVADLIWERFGEVTNLVDPFFGSGALLLARPQPFGGVETVNDIDSYLCNFWRAIRADPEAVAAYAGDPVIEQDLHARHLWLVNQAEFRERMMVDPEFCDAKIAGWWVWGLCCWIGGVWCRKLYRQLPHMGNAGRGVHRQLPQIGEEDRAADLLACFEALAARFERVRVACGDWTRVLGPSVLSFTGASTTAVFLDPPYSAGAGRDPDLYTNDDLEVAHVVRAWAIAHGTNPNLRICLAGYEGEHDLPDDWECVAWKTRGGYSLVGQNGTNGNEHRERLWFSPFCVKPERDRMPLFAGLGWDD